MLAPPRTDVEAIERFRMLIPQRIGYLLDGCPIWKPGVLPLVGAKGNCSIAATWALGLSILQGADTWLNSAGIFNDAITPGGLFTKIPVALPGCLAVVTKRPGDVAGHVGLVTEVDSRGRPARIIDCSPRNGREDSVREHGAEFFLGRPDTIFVWYTGIASTVGLSAARPAPVASAYTPPTSVLSLLGAITAAAQRAPRIKSSLAGLEYLCVLPGGAVFFQSDLDLDTDGVRDPEIRADGWDRTHQDEVSMGGAVNANKLPYIVLPQAFAQAHGVRLGDVAAVLHKGRLEFAVFADQGPAPKIGEGSIALHRALGYERVVDGRIHDVGIPDGVVTIVFPGSGRARDIDAIRAIGRRCFVALGGVLP